MVTKIAFCAEGHVLSSEDCTEIARLIKDNFNFKSANKRLREDNQRMLATLQEKSKVKVYRLDDSRLIVSDDGELTFIDGASRADTVIIRHLVAE